MLDLQFAVYGNTPESTPTSMMYADRQPGFALMIDPAGASCLLVFLLRDARRGFAATTGPACSLIPKAVMTFITVENSGFPSADSAL